MYDGVNRSLEEMRAAMEQAEPAADRPHDPYIIVAVEEAVAAASEGNFGVGAVIVDPDGNIVERGHNHVFNPHFRSDIHAEMDVLTRFEENNKDLGSTKGYSLYTSLEPCPMCLTRLITSGISHIYHAAPDTESGMVSRLDQLTPVWVDLAGDQEFAAADCSPELGDLALEIFLYTAERNTEKLLSRRR